VLEILRNGGRPEASSKWANSCVASGECLKVCDYGVNPRFLLTMARIAMARTKNEPRQQRKLGVDGFRLVARDVMQLSRMQLTEALAGLDRTQELLREVPEDQNPRRTQSIGQLQATVVFENVSFSYQAGKPVLHEVRFDSDEIVDLFG
jgi:ABC-type multidrug transport system fused ATPase/permease subunit